MSIEGIIEEIDSEITKLTQARALLTGISTVKRRGRPARVVGVVKKRKSTMSPEGRARIAAAMKKRWADKRAKAKK